MKVSHLFYRRMLLVCALLCFAVAAILILGVIQPVKDEVLRGGTPERALQAFWVNIILNLLTSVTLLAIAFWSKGGSWFSTSVLVVVGLVALFLGLALTDAGTAYRSHGPEMQTASVILLFCSAADVLAGIMVVTAVFLRPKRA
jgi:hypothetical protein